MRSRGVRSGRKPGLLSLGGSALILLVLLLPVLLPRCSSAEKTVTVCILDSGCSDDHAQGESFLEDADDLTDSIGHGTHICSLVREAAPEAKVVMLKCFDTRDTLNEKAVVNALYAAVDTYHADVINMSWTIPEESEALHKAILHAHDQGAILVACTGNLSVTTGLGTVAYPAAWEEVIGVAGVDLDDQGAPKTSLWYLYGKAVEFCARGDCTRDKGSSYAAARVSGFIAAALQSGVEPSRIPEHLAALSRDMGESGYDSRFGWGYLETP